MNNVESTDGGGGIMLGADGTVEDAVVVTVALTPALVALDVGDTPKVDFRRFSLLSRPRSEMCLQHSGRPD